MDVAKTIGSALGAGIATVLVAGMGAPAAAQTPEEFYKGKTVTVMLGHPPGGSYHMYATLAVNHLKKHIPGNPNVIIEHRPGGGGVRAARHFYTNTPRDGFVIAWFLETLCAHRDSSSRGRAWKTLEMNYIGNFAGVGAVTMRRQNAPAKTIAEMRRPCRASAAPARPRRPIRPRR